MRALKLLASAKDSLKILRPLVQEYPTSEMAWLVLGRAWVVRENWTEAGAALRELETASALAAAKK